MASCRHSARVAGKATTTHSNEHSEKGTKEDRHTKQTFNNRTSNSIHHAYKYGHVSLAVDMPSIIQF
jgi:hypothetical protein